MLRKFQKLIELKIRHGYYQDQVCRDFEVVPTAATCKLLTDLRALFKPRADGFTVLGDNQNLDPFPSAKLSFWLKLRNPDFLYFTNCLWESGNSNAIHYFSNEKVGDSPTAATATLETDDIDRIPTHRIVLPRPPRFTLRADEALSLAALESGLSVCFRQYFPPRTHAQFPFDPTNVLSNEPPFSAAVDLPRNDALYRLEVRGSEPEVKYDDWVFVADDFHPSSQIFGVVEVDFPAPTSSVAAPSASEGASYELFFRPRLSSWVYLVPEEFSADAKISDAEARDVAIGNSDAETGEDAAAGDVSAGDAEAGAITAVPAAEVGSASSDVPSNPPSENAIPSRFRPAASPTKYDIDGATLTFERRGTVGTFARFEASHELPFYELPKRNLILTRVSSPEYFRTLPNPDVRALKPKDPADLSAGWFAESIVQI